MCSTVTVNRSTCTAPLLYIGQHVQYRYCISVNVYSTVTVYRSTCAVPLLYIGQRVQYRYCISVNMYSTFTVYRSTCTAPLFLADCSETRIFWQIFEKMVEYQISWKSVQWEPSCSMRTNGRTDMPNLIVAFRNFAKAPANWSLGPVAVWAPCSMYGSVLNLFRSVRSYLVLRLSVNGSVSWHCASARCTCHVAVTYRVT
jgi:hypothetical protein